ncbi:MAG: glycosyltransferase family 4 protein, partial [Muribaculaceae bacterium]|nr:glycosyltransferase family 4 protein [Muribaculaceae bacterium]
VGWNWIVNLAKECNVHVITESEWEADINKALDCLPQKDNLHFYFNPVTQEVRDKCWHQGDWSFYRYYRQWQKRTLEIARKIIGSTEIDIIHQLNMIGFREPGYLWTIKDIPFIWGPIGNMAPVPLNLLEGSLFKDRLKLRLKNAISYYQARTGRVRKAIRRADRLITVLNSTADIIQHVYGVDNVIVMPETGLRVTEQVVHDAQSHRPLRILWVGRFIPTKKLDLALNIVAKSDVSNLELHIVGWGTPDEEEYYRILAEKLGISDQCVWHGKIPNNDVQQLMRESDIFLFTSVLEGTPHVVLEAIANNLPVICFDMCGQGVIVNDSVGWKYSVGSLNEAVDQMIRTINEVDKNRTLISEKSRNCEIRKPQLSWEYKIEQVIKLYNNVIDEYAR